MESYGCRTASLWHHQATKYPKSDLFTGGRLTFNLDVLVSASSGYHKMCYIA